MSKTSLFAVLLVTFIGALFAFSFASIFLTAFFDSALAESLGNAPVAIDNLSGLAANIPLSGALIYIFNRVLDRDSARETAFSNRESERESAQSKREENALERQLKFNDAMHDLASAVRALSESHQNKRGS